MWMSVCLDTALTRTPSVPAPPSSAEQSGHPLCCGRCLIGRSSGPCRPEGTKLPHVQNLPLVRALQHGCHGRRPCARDATGLKAGLSMANMCSVAAAAVQGSLARQHWA